MISRQFPQCNLYVMAPKGTCPKIRCCDVIVLGQMVSANDNTHLFKLVLHGAMSDEQNNPMKQANLHPCVEGQCLNCAQEQAA